MISPWDREAVCASARRTRRLLVVHEDNLNAGFGAEVVATVAESADARIEGRRVTRPDTFIPCNFGAQLETLPSYQRTLEAAAELLGMDLAWESLPEAQGDRQVVTVLGSPTDQTIEVVELLVHAGQCVRAGDMLATVEADKAAFEVASPVVVRWLSCI